MRLELQCSWDGPLVAAVLPSGLTSLTFDEGFNQPLTTDVLPSGLTTLTLGYQFNCALRRHVLPPGLTSLTFEGRFNQALPARVLPPGLTSLRLGNCQPHLRLPLQPPAAPRLAAAVCRVPCFRQRVQLAP